MSKLFDYNIELEELKPILLKLNIKPNIISNIKSLLMSYIYIAYENTIPKEYINISYIDIFNQKHIISINFEKFKEFKFN